MMMGKPDMGQHQHRVGDGRKDYYTQKQNDKMTHKGSSSGKNDSRTLKANIIAQIPGAIRVCGDWSEQLSSNGKLYFFNIKTKSSQWERPKDWSNSRAIDVKKEKSKLQHNRASVKHSGDTSSGGHLSAAKLQKTAHSHGSDGKKALARQRSGHDVHSNKEYKDRDYRTSNVKDRDYRDLDYRDKRMPESRHGGNHVDPGKSQDRDYRSTNSAHETRHGIGRQNSESAASHAKARTYGDKISESNSRCEGADVRDDGTCREERSKSSSSTPLSSQDVPKAASSNAGLNGSANARTLNGDGSSALVETLSSVLNQANKASVEEKAESTSIEGNLKTALQMLLNAAAQSQQLPGTTESDEKEKMEPTHFKKPRLGEVTDELTSRSAETCKVAERVLETLRGFYDEKYIGHVQGWPAEQMERQSVRLCDENHLFVVNHTSQLSTSMKMSRSRVRSAEIHSTIQEQRILYLRQQVKDLEKMSTTTPFS